MNLEHSLADELDADYAEELDDEIDEDYEDYDDYDEDVGAKRKRSWKKPIFLGITLVAIAIASSVIYSHYAKVTLDTTNVREFTLSHLFIDTGHYICLQDSAGKGYALNATESISELFIQLDPEQPVHAAVGLYENHPYLLVLKQGTDHVLFGIRGVFQEAELGENLPELVYINDAKQAEQLDTRKITNFGGSYSTNRDT